MTTPYKLLTGLIILIGIFVGGFYTGKGQSKVEIQEKVITKEGESKTVYKDRIVTVTKTIKPDGTITEETKTEEKQGSKETKTASKEKDKTTVTTPILSNYSLGLKYWASLDDKLDVGKAKDRNNYEVTAGRRLLGEAWLTGGVRLDKQVSLGVSFNF